MVYSLAVISLEVVIKYLFRINFRLQDIICGHSPGGFGPADINNFVMMTSILPMESKRCKLSDQVAGSVPYLHHVTVCYRNVFAVG